MNSTLKNITTVLMLVTFAFGGYYLFLKKDASELDLAGGSVDQELFADVQKYIERRQLLDQVQLDTTLFNDKRFQSLEKFSTEVVPQPISRPNPFDKVSGLPS